MRVEFRTRKGVSGEVVLRDGVAVGSNEKIRRLLDETTIVEPNTLVLLTPEDGERYLRALPYTFGATGYSWTVLVE